MFVANKQLARFRLSVLPSGPSGPGLKSCTFMLGCRLAAIGTKMETRRNYGPVLVSEAKGPCQASTGSDRIGRCEAVGKTVQNS